MILQGTELGKIINKFQIALEMRFDDKFIKRGAEIR